MKERGKRSSHRQSEKSYRPYLLRGFVYCYSCCCNPLEEADFPSWGKMYCRTHSKHETSYYYCSASQRAGNCGQKSVNVDDIDAQVLNALLQLKPPADWRDKIAHAISETIGHQNTEKRLEEIKDTIKRMDFRWDNGFITDKADYMEKRLQLQQELDQLTPAYDELDRAFDLLNNFEQYWDDYGSDVEKQHELLKLILERVYIHEKEVIAITLKSDYHFVLGHNPNEPTYTEVDPLARVWAQRDLNSRPHGCEPCALTS